MTFEWRAPKRYRNGHETLTSIPNEIYLEIFSFVEHKPKSTWVKLSQVCSFFHSLCLPKAFEEIALDCANPPQRQIEFYQALTRGSPLATSIAENIKRCTIFDYNRHSATNHFYVEAFMCALAHMPGLHTLTIQTIYLTPSILLAISRLTALKKLVLANVDPGLQPLLIQQVKGLENLPHLESYECITSYPFPPRSHPDLASSLCTVIMQRPRLRRLSLCYWAVASKFLQMQVDEQVAVELESLMLDEVRDPSLLVKFLVKTPSLTELSIGTGRPPAMSELPLTALPKLHTLSCPPAWVDTLLGGDAARRNLKALHINPVWIGVRSSDAWINGGLNISDKASIPIDWARDWKPLTSPRVLCFNVGLLDLQELCQEIGRIGDQDTVFDNVEMIEINGYSPPPSLERDHVVSITQKFPKANIIRLVSAGEWIRPMESKAEWVWHGDSL